MSCVPAVWPSFCANAHNPNGQNKLVAHRPLCYKISARRNPQRNLNGAIQSFKLRSIWKSYWWWLLKIITIFWTFTFSLLNQLNFQEKMASPKSWNHGNESVRPWDYVLHWSPDWRHPAPEERSHMSSHKLLEQVIGPKSKVKKCNQKIKLHSTHIFRHN